MDFRKQQSEHLPIHIDGTAVEKMESFKFLGVHITDKLKWSTHTDSVVKKTQQCLINPRRLKKFGLAPKTLTNFYRCTFRASCRAVTPPGTATAQPANAGLSKRVLPGHLQHPMSQEVQKDHQGHQKPEPRPVHQAIIQKAKSVQVHQSWDRETEKQLLPQDRQIVKSLAGFHPVIQPCTLEAATLYTWNHWPL